jgi:hypothetical protein
VLIFLTKRNVVGFYKKITTKNPQFNSPRVRLFKRQGMVKAEEAI